jgi:CheY-like chemotaxis protein/two-component sensor histidine kinase
MWMTRVDGAAYFTASINDLSQAHADAEVIARQRDALRQSEKLTAMGSLLAGVAHELNNPLAIVMGRASLLEEKTEGTPLHADAARIRDAAERCGRIVRTFLNMARSRPAQHAPVQLNDLARAAADMLGYTLRSHGIEVDLRLAADLPEVQADGDQIGQVVLNLIVNAQQALAQHGGPRRITVLSGLDGPRSVFLRVADSGPGVPAAVRDKIFDPFFTTKADGMGTGMGLSVSRSIARDHGGDLVLEDTATGARFALSLPLRAAAPVAAPEATPVPEAAAGPARLLVVDDEAEIAELLRTLLEGAGFEVASADAGAVALELLDTARFDAIVSDLRMPDMDGAALWRAVRERHPALATRMVFVTGDTLSPQARQFLDASGCQRLDKPFSRDDLLARVHRALRPDPADD